MYRRRYLSLLTAIGLAGCSTANDVVDSSPKPLGETVTYDDLEVTVTDAMTSSQITIDDSDVTAPSNGTFALFEIEVRNTDVTEHEGPFVNTANYDTLEKEDDTVYTRGVNDIRVYGSGEGGHLPDTDEITRVSGYELSLLGNTLATYPHSPTRPQIAADSTISGWVIGTIKSEQTPQVQITFDGTSTRWTAESADLSTPSPTSTE